MIPGFFAVGGVKWPARDIDYSPPSGAAIKKEWRCTPILPTCASWPRQGQLYLCVCIRKREERES